MDKRFDKLEEKLDKIEDRLTSIDVTLARNTSDLESHMKRTALLEKSLDIVKDDIKPSIRHVQQVSGALKLIGLIATIGGIIKLGMEILNIN